jgi:hypothetical protein
MKGQFDFNDGGTLMRGQSVALLAFVGMALLFAAATQRGNAAEYYVAR